MTNVSVPCPDGMRIALRADRRLLPADTPCQRYVLLTVAAPGRRREAARPPLNLSIILDRSGSMSGAKLDRVKEAASYAVRLLSDRDRASIVVYDDEVRVVCPSSRVTPQHSARLQKAIGAIESGGMTNLAGGWLTGCDQIAGHQSDETMNRALLLTDGLANVGLTDPEVLAHHAKELRQRGVSTTTFGVGEGFAESLLMALSAAGGGHFFFIAHPSQIPGYFEQELNEMLETVARELAIEVMAPEGARLTLVNDLPHEQHGARLHLPLGDASNGEERRLLFRVELPAGPLDRRVELSARLTYLDPTTGARPSAAASLAFTSVRVEQADAQPVDQEVIDDAAHVSVEAAKLQAVQLERQGAVHEAATLLKRVASDACAMAPSPALQRAIQADADDLSDAVLNRTLDEARRKEVSFASYLSANSRRDRNRSK